MKHLSSSLYPIVAFLFFGCSQSQPESSNNAVIKDNVPAQDVVLITSFDSKKERSTSTASQQELVNWAEQINLFAFSEYASAPSNENFLVTPYNELSFFALISLGAEADSLEQINKRYGFESSYFSAQSELLLKTVNSFDLQLNTNDPVTNISFSTKTSLWGKNTHAFSETFLADSIAYFGAQLFPADFANNGVKVAEEYTQQTANNSVIAERTATFNSEELLDTVLLVSQSSSLKTNWQFPFLENKTVLGDFTLLDHSVIETQMMNIQLDTQFYDNGSEFLISLPTQDTNWTVYLVASSAIDDHESLKANMSLNKLQAMKDEAVLSNVQLTAPSFTLITHDYGTGSPLFGLSYLSDSLSSLFDKTNADLSSINANLSANLYLKTLDNYRSIEVDEKGIKIGSEYEMNIAQKPETESYSQSSSFSSTYYDNANFTIKQPTAITANLNRPFTFFVYYHPTNTVIYAGQLINPV